MTQDVLDRARRAFGDHDSFERIGNEHTYAAVRTPFDGRVRVEVVGNGRLGFRVRVRVPTLSAVVEDDVASIVEEGWYETFALRIEDVGGVTRAEHDLDPTVRIEDEAVIVEVDFEEINERRGVDDVAAIVSYVEGTYVQGVIPGYDYVDPVAGLLERARTAGSDGSAP